MDAPIIILRSFRFLERLPRFRARKIQANVSVWIVGKMRKLVVDAPISSWEGEYPHHLGHCYLYHVALLQLKVGL